MTIFERIKKSHENIKKQPKEERWQYFLDYYKWHMVAIVLVIALLIQGIVSLTNQKEVVFSGILLNCKISVEEDAFLSGFYDAAGIDANTQEAAFYSDLILKDGSSKSDVYNFQRIMAGVAIQEFDFLVGQTDSFRLCANSTGRIFVDLRNFLDAEVLEQLSGRLYYVDGTFIEKLSAPVGESVDLSLTDAPDPTKPELMEDPIPVGIDISDREALRDAYYLTDTTLYIGIITTTGRPETAKAFINYIFSE